MNCAVHTDTPAAAFCRTCGKALCENCKRDVMGAIYCEPCIAARLQTAPAGVPGQPVVPVAAVSNAPSPGIAMLLGFIPGVGAMYNGQFMKGFVHVVIFVLLIIASSNVSGWFGPLIAFWIFYMAFDAYKTAQAKMLGLPLPDPLGLDKLFGIQESSAPAVPFAAPATSASAPAANVAAATSPAPVADQPVADPQQTPVGAIVLIALGVLFLLGNIGIFNLHRMWPLFLIGLGLWIAYKHMSQTEGMQGGR
jgi:cell wall-active antibiotic response 4TMS protein YvqF/B-box zinc finger protein